MDKHINHRKDGRGKKWSPLPDSHRHASIEFKSESLVIRWTIKHPGFVIPIIAATLFGIVLAAPMVKYLVR
jgi:hypothetical protein